MLHQTLIPFQPIRSNPRKQSSEPVRPFLPPQPAPELPTEIWNVILAFLHGHTLALKTLRLVCRYWSRVGAEPLFSTAYLDGGSTSWSRLLALSQSPFAQYVTKIEWNPLVLYGECLDGLSWHARYPNLLKGAGHGIALQLYSAFRAVYARECKRGAVDRANAQAVKKSMNDLHNCRKLSISDTLDFEATCADGITNGRIQNDESLWKSLAIWGRQVRHGVRGRRVCWESEDVFRTVTYLLEIAGSSGQITHLDVDLWDTSNSAYFIPLLQIAMPSAITTLCMSLKTCQINDEAVREYAYEAWTRIGLGVKLVPCFSGLHKLSLGTVYTHPDAEIMNAIELVRLSLDNSEDGTLQDDLDCAEDMSPVVVAKDFSEVEERCGRPGGFTPAMLSTTYADVQFDNSVHSLDLRKITLSNVSINLGSLAFWLLDQPRLSTRSFTIHLTDCVILYGMSMHVFLATLAAINVHLLYDHETTLYYGKDCSSPDNDYIGDTSGDACLLTPWLDISASHLVEDYNFCRLYEYISDPDPISSDFVSVVFKHPASLHKAINKKSIAERYNTRTSYGYGFFESSFTDSHGIERRHIVYQWVNSTEVPSRNKVGDTRFYGIQKLTIRTYRGWNYQDDDLYDDLRIQAARMWGEARFLEEAKLKIYETEILGSDLIEQYEGSQEHVG